MTRHDLEAQIAASVADYSHHRYYPSQVCFGRAPTIKHAAGCLKSHRCAKTSFIVISSVLKILVGEAQQAGRSN